MSNACLARNILLSDDDGYGVVVNDNAVLVGSSSCWSSTHIYSNLRSITPILTLGESCAILFCRNISFIVCPRKLPVDAYI